MRSRPVLRRAARVALLAVVGVLATAFVVPAAANADPGDIGYFDHTFGTASGTGSPTGNKESKVWFNDGFWWADMFAGTAAKHTIHKLNRTTHRWEDTGVALDDRANSRSDILWDAVGNKLYVASHRFSESPALSSATSYEGRVYRYSYNAATDRYALDQNFPAVVNGSSSETLIIDKDTTGKVWVTWVQGGKVWLAHTTTSDAAWTAPFALPGIPAVGSDDISSLVAFGNKIGVLWSNETSASNGMYFATHIDGSSDTAWDVKNINTGWSADDHISLRADSAGQVWAATKTSEDASGKPEILLSRRTAGGTWSHAVFGTGRYHTRPALLLDEQTRTVHVFATCPHAANGTNGQSGGDICEKTVSMDNPGALDPAGRGESIIHDETTGDMNNVTTTKQNVTSQSGIVVLATMDEDDTYWFSDRAGSGPPPQGPPIANFSATPTSGTAPLSVQFTNGSTGNPAPTSYSWNFGDPSSGAANTSTDPSPSHVYHQNGTYTVTLTATNAVGSDPETKTALITVADAPPPQSDLAFTAVADAPVKSTSPTKNYGSDAELRLRQDASAGGVNYRSYLKFNVTGLTGTPTSARLRLYSTDGSPDGGRAWRVADTSWTETGITWNTKPDIGATSLGAAGTTANNAYVDIPLGNPVTANGTYSFALTTTSSNSQYYMSKEGVNKPQLILSSTGGGPAPPGPPALAADFTPSATSGQATLDVTFTDTSTGSPDGWSWNFGDPASGSANTSTERNPSHSYAQAGTYTVTLTATRSSDGATSAPKIKTGLITVTSAPPPGGTGTVTAIADGHVKNSNPTTKYGTATTMQVRKGDASNTITYRSFVKFDVTGLTGAAPGAKLRLFVTDASPDGGSVYRVPDTSWTEASLTWNTAPALPATSLGTVGQAVAGQWVEVNLGSTITGNGTYSFAIDGLNSNSAIYATRESANKPQLLLPTAA